MLVSLTAQWPVRHTGYFDSILSWTRTLPITSTVQVFCIMLMLASSMLPNNVIRCAKAHSTGEFRRESRFQLDFCDKLVVSAFDTNTQDS
jgi:hypothetical protein